MIGPATANISSPDFDGGTSLIHNNFASYGGGIAIKGSDSGSAIALVFTTDPSSPVGIRENTATHTGGGVYVDSQTGSSFAYLRAWDYRIEGNTAVEGAAIYADVEGNNGAAVWLGNLSGNVVLFPTNLGAVPCNNPSLCNTINGNTTSNPDSGSIILIHDHGSLLANRFFMRDNIADHAIRIVGDNVNVVLFNGLLAGNTLQHELIYESGNITPTFINSCTLANDVINAAHVIHTESDLTLTDTIISEPGTLTLDYSGNPDNLVVNYVLSNDISTLPGNGTGVALGAPTFVDLAGGDFHLKADSLGIDFAPTSGDGYYVVHNLIDLDGKPRNVDLPSAGSAFGTQDLGAYELQNLFRECGTSDSIFCDGYDHP